MSENTSRATGSKKRKRREENGQNSSRQKPASSQPGRKFPWLESDLVEVDERDIPPFIIQPAAGISLPNNVRFLVYSRKLTGTELPKDATSIEKSEYRLYSDDHPMFEFFGYEDEACQGRRIFVGATDPNTGEHQMMQVKQMVVRGTIKSRRHEEGAPGQNGDAEPTAAQRKELLGGEFGNAKQKRTINQRLKNQVVPSLDKDGMPKELNASAKAVLLAIEEATAGRTSKEDLDAQSAALKPIPVPNRFATNIRDVYRPSAFIGNAVLSSIDVSDWISAVSAGENVQLSSRFVAKRLNAVVRGHDDGQQREGDEEDDNPTDNVRLLRYLLYLITFAADTKLVGKSKRMAPGRRMFEEKTGASDAVFEHLKQKFTLPGTANEITPHTFTLLMTTALAVAAIIEGFEFDMADLTLDLRQPQVALTKYFKELGGKVKKQKKGEMYQFLAKLELPLQFPTVRVPRQKRR